MVNLLVLQMVEYRVVFLLQVECYPCAFLNITSLEDCIKLERDNRFTCSRNFPSDLYKVRMPLVIFFLMSRLKQFSLSETICILLGG